MLQQRTHHSRRTYDFPQRLARFQEESGLSWPEIARRPGTYRHTVWRWAEGRVRPNVKHMMALLELTKDLGPVDIQIQITNDGLAEEPGGINWL